MGLLEQTPALTRSTIGWPGLDRVNARETPVGPAEFRQTIDLDESTVNHWQFIRNDVVTVIGAGKHNSETKIGRHTS